MESRREFESGTNPDWPDLDMASGRFPLMAGGVAKDGPEAAARAVTF
jgi:hypothetical protein